MEEEAVKSMRYGKICAAIFLSVLAIAGRAADLAGMKVAVSIRHFLPGDQRSYFHVFLYQGDGKLIRALTSQAGVNDVNPVFSPDGKEVCFTRKGAKSGGGTGDEYYLIHDLDKPSAPVRIAQPPEWYRPDHPTVVEPKVADVAPIQESFEGDLSVWTSFSPDRAYEIRVHSLDVPISEKTAETWWLVDHLTSQTLPLSTFKGFEKLPELDWHFIYFIYADSLKAAIFYCHLNSTEHNTDFALNLKDHSFTTLTLNGGNAFPIPELPGFFFVSDELYQPTGEGRRTVDCQYLDFWNEKLERTRFAPKLSQYGGAAVFVTGKGAFVIPQNR
jgi:hypothetical protein